MKKNKFSKGLKVIILTSVVICVGLLIGMFILLGNNKIPTDITVEYLQEKATSKINSYKYAKLMLDSEYTGTQDIPNVCEYVLTSSKDTSYHTYTYRDEEQDLYQCWDNHGDHYDLYIYDKTKEKWVSSKLDSEPVTSNTWDIVADLGEYTILDEAGNWGDDECWVLQMTGVSEGWEVLYQELYIRKKDFMPVGVLSYANSKLDKDRSSDITPGEYEFGSVTGGTAEVTDYEEVISMYSIEFSNETLDLFDKPEDFITEEEYNKLTEAKESEEDVTTDN